VRDYVRVWTVWLSFQPTPPPDPAFNVTQFYETKDAADADIALYSGQPDFILHLSDWRWYKLDAKSFIRWLNLTGIGNYQLLIDGTQSIDLTDERILVNSPRQSGCNSAVEASPDYGGTVKEAAARKVTGGSGSFVLSLGGYLELIYEQLLAKGQIAHADMVKSIRDKWIAGEITDAEALTQLEAVSRLL
jgi:hypothetical protein